MGMLKKATSGVLALLDGPPPSRGHAFLTIPLAADVDHSSGIYRLWEVKYSTGPL
jgi:hypothetical protein